MTPDEFSGKMAEYASERYDIEEGHVRADALMVEVLRSLGYGQGCEIFEKLWKWYA